MANRQHILISLVLVILCLVIYGKTLTHEFISYDDTLYVTNNWKVMAGLTLDSVVWAFTTSAVANWHPLTWLSHMLDCQIYGLQSWGHHLTNLVFHIANCILLFHVLLRLTKHPGENWVGPSALAAAWFAIHPLHVESVAWVAERKDVLSTFFWMLTMGGYALYVERPSVRRYGLVIVPFALGLMAKPMLVTLPCVLLLLDYWPLRRFEPVAGPKNKITPPNYVAIIGEKVPLFALTILSSVITFVVQQRSGAVLSLDAIPLGARLANALVSYLRYVGKIFWPQHLSIYYPNQTQNLPVWLIALAFLALAAVSVAVLYSRKNHPFLLVGWLWYLGTLVPVIGIVQVGTQAMADRYTYIPSIGLFLMGAGFLHQVASQNPRLKSPIRYGALLSVAILTLVATFQVQYWRNSEALFKHAIEVTTDNAVAHNSLGTLLHQEKKYKEAEAEYREALRINPKHSIAYTNLAGLAAESGRLDEAVALCKKAVEINSISKQGQYYLALFLTKQQKYEEALEHIEWAVWINPNDPNAHLCHGSVLLALGRTEEAAECYRTALRLNPYLAEAHSGLGDCLVRQGQGAEAESHCRQAIALNPGYAEAYDNLGSALASRNRFEEAIAQYNNAIKINPGFVRAHFNLGSVFLNIGRFKEAASQFRKVLELNPGHPYARQLQLESERKNYLEKKTSP